MKDQLLKMAGLKVDWKGGELRKMPLTDKLDNPNFESVNLENLKTLSTNELPKLQGFNCYGMFAGFSKIELIFTNGL